MAWRIQDYRGTLMLSHAGAIDGFEAQIILLPKEGIGIALLCNLNQSAHQPGAGQQPRRFVPRPAERRIGTATSSAS